MKKLFSIVLIFILTLTLFGVTNHVSAVSDDVTINLHIHQADGDYSSSGTGVWDGVYWNDWSDVVTTQDQFGGIITKTWSITDFQLLSDEIQFKPTRDVTIDDPSNYLAPGIINGQVFFDITNYKDGLSHTLDLYYVEGAFDLYLAPEDKGLIFVVYANPQALDNPTVYDGWNIWTWGNGNTGSSEAVEFFTTIEHTIMIDDQPKPLQLKLVAIEVDANADLDPSTQDTGFIVRNDNWEKQCETDILINNDDLLGSGAEVFYYMSGTCHLQSDTNIFKDDLMNALNIAPPNYFTQAMVIDNNAISFMMSEQKHYRELGLDRFKVSNSLNEIIPVSWINYPMTPLGEYPSDVMVNTETIVVLFVDTPSVHSNLGLVGNLQGWDPSTAIAPMPSDYNGYAAFEFTTDYPNLDFKILEDTDENGFTWEDVQLSLDNMQITIPLGNTVYLMYDSELDTVFQITDHGYYVDSTMFTYIPTASCSVDENLLTVFINTSVDFNTLGIVGTFNNWTAEDAIAPTGVTESGEVVFEVCTLNNDMGAFKVLSDPDGDGFIWDDTVDPEITPNDIKFDFYYQNPASIYVDMEQFNIFKDYLPTITTTNTYLLSVYMNGNADFNKIGIVGSSQNNPWIAEEASTYMAIDEFGNYIYELVSSEPFIEYIILYDMDDDGFEFDDKISGDENIFAPIDPSGRFIQFNMINEGQLEYTEYIGPNLDMMHTNYAELYFEPGSLQANETYLLEYIEGYDMNNNEIIISAYTNGFVNPGLHILPRDEYMQWGTYFINPTLLKLQLSESFNGLSTFLIHNVTQDYTLDIPASLPYSIGDYTSDTTCQPDNVLTYIHLALTQTPDDDLSKFGIVGTFNGWDITNALPAVGIDTLGNYVFEICTQDSAALLMAVENEWPLVEAGQVAYESVLNDPTSTQEEIDAALAEYQSFLDNYNNYYAAYEASLIQEFKIKYDRDGDGFDWDPMTNPELTPFNIWIEPSDNQHHLIIEGAQKFNATNTFFAELPSDKAVELDDYITIFIETPQGEEVSYDFYVMNDYPMIKFDSPNGEYINIGLNQPFDYNDYIFNIHAFDFLEGPLEFIVSENIDTSVQGEQMFTIEATDSWGQTSVVVIYVYIDNFDNEGPTFDPIGDITIEAGTTPIDWTTYMNNLSDDDETITVWESVDMVDYDTPGTYLVIVNAMDGLYNQSNESFNVTVKDTVAPEFMEIDDQIIEAGISDIDWTYYMYHLSDASDSILTKEEYEDFIDYDTPGEYTVTVKLFDESNNEAMQTFTVTVVDTTAPLFTITLNPDIGEVDFTSYVEELFDNSDGELTVAIEVNNIDYNTPGTYSVIVSVSDPSHNITLKAFNVIIPNILELDFDPIDVQTVELGSTSVDWTTLIQNESDGTVKSIESDQTDYMTVGTYTVTVKINDDMGNQKTRDFTVNVVDTVAPTALLNSALTTINKGTNFVDTGVESFDYATVTTSVSGEVDYDTPGTYELIYTLTDASNNSSTIKRIVHVVDQDLITFELGKALTTIPVNTNYQDGDCSVFVNGSEFDCTVKENTVDITTVGVYTITYSYTHNSVEYTYMRYVFISDGVTDITLYYRKDEELGDWV